MRKTSGRGCAFALGLVLALAAPAARSRAEPTATPVHSVQRVPVPGAELYVEIHGADARAPTLLWLHGGPGGAERPLFRYFDSDLEEHFVVAYWDQRGTGRSFDPDADPRALTIARHRADLAEVAARLRHDRAGERIVLVGHSWGAALGALYARDHPNDVAALVAVAPLVATLDSQRAEHAFLREEAVRRRDADALRELEEIGPPPWADADRSLSAERIASRYGALFHRQPNRVGILFGGVLRGLVTPWEIPGLIRGNEVSLRAMQAELLGLDLRRSVPRLEVPVFFLLGRHDRHVDARIAAAYYETLQAPRKSLVWFEESAHNVPFEEPERFQRTLVEALAILPPSPSAG